MQLDLASVPGLRALRKPAVFALLLVAALVAATGAYLIWMDWGMRHMDQAADMLLMPRMIGWGAIDLALVFLMWALMMVAMMAPSAVPAARLVARIVETAWGAAPARRSVSVFLGGYLLVWVAFSVGATLLHWGLLSAALVSPMMQSSAPPLSALILMAAGAYQFSPIKNICLRRCQSPLSLMIECAGWRGHDPLNAGVRLGVFLRRLLLGADGRTVGDRRDEYPLGGPTGDLRTGGEEHATPDLDPARCGRIAHGLGRLAAAGNGLITRSTSHNTRSNIRVNRTHKRRRCACRLRAG